VVLTQGGDPPALRSGRSCPGLLSCRPYQGSGGDMNDERLRGFGRLWANQRLQARPGFAWLVVLPPRPGLPEPERSAYYA